MSDSVRPHRRPPTRLPRPWDSPGKNTGVGCHFLLQCMKLKTESEVAQSCLTLRDPIDCSPPGSSTDEIFQARALAWIAIAIALGDCYLEQKSQLHQDIMDQRTRKQENNKNHLKYKNQIKTYKNKCFSWLTVINTLLLKGVGFYKMHMLFCYKLSQSILAQM